MNTQTNSNTPEVAIVMGSQTDLPTMKDAAAALEKFGITYEIRILSAHRTPDEVADFSRSASPKGVKIIIAGAGGAAHLPGMIAALTELPVIGVPVAIGQLQGQDALYSIVQMPKGIPVATVSIGNAWNAGILAIQMLAIQDASIQNGKDLKKCLRDYKEEMRATVLAGASKL